MAIRGYFIATLLPRITMLWTRYENSDKILFFRMRLTQCWSKAYVTFNWGLLERQMRLIWKANEADLKGKWGWLDGNHNASGITSRRILYYVGTHLLLHQDVSDATSGRNFYCIGWDFMENTILFPWNFPIFCQR